MTFGSRTELRYLALKGRDMELTPRNKRIIAMAIAFIALVALIATMFYNGLTVKHYRVHTDKFEAGDSLRIVLVADLHSHIYGHGQGDLISVIEGQSPDIIVLAGDIADDVAPFDGAKLLVSGIADIAPVFYVSGNHEYWSGDIENIKETIRALGVAVLEDEYKEIEISGIALVVAGADDPEWVHYEDKAGLKPMDESFKELAHKGQFKILVAHRPELIETYKGYSFDLVLSGHTHGGVVRIPLLSNGLFAAHQGWFPKYVGGVYKHDGLTHIVSRGVSFNPKTPRIFNPPEVSVIDVSKE